MKRASSDRTETVRTRLTETWDKTQIKKKTAVKDKTLETAEATHFREDHDG